MQEIDATASALREQAAMLDALLARFLVADERGANPVRGLALNPALELVR